jgi:hypothetical protein
VGLDPKTRWHVEVVYHDGADIVVRRVVGQDNGLFPLKDKFLFELDKTGRQLHVFLAHLFEPSIL